MCYFCLHPWGINEKELHLTLVCVLYAKMMVTCRGKVILEIPILQIQTYFITLG